MDGNRLNNRTIVLFFDTMWLAERAAHLCLSPRVHVRPNRAVSMHVFLCVTIPLGYQPNRRLCR